MARISEVLAVFRAVDGEPQEEGTIMAAMGEVVNIPYEDAAVGTRHWKPQKKQRMNMVKPPH
jgi:hypothetical protein